MKILEWEKDLEQRTTEQLNALLTAFNTILQWDTFVKEYQWTGIQTIRQLVEFELIQRDAKRLEAK